ncbi:MAG: pyridoxamine 5'-phosphate oxidase family protein [Rhizobiales bacterium]|nr:pyridoxamine 5'-phosphate oxidase family protein [Hyphomicrobiales bacterium]
MARAFAEIAFTTSVRAHQARMGSADGYAGFLNRDTERGNVLGSKEQEFIAARDGFYQATVSETDWPYVQFRGGPIGFLKILSPTSIAYADFRGNRQYVSVGNLLKNDRVSMILMDYPNRRRLKIWGRARLIETADEPDIAAQLHDASYRAKPERAVIIDVAAFDWNCPQHIPVRLTAEELQPHLADLHSEIERLSAENEQLKKGE